MDSKWSGEGTVELVEHRLIICDEFNIEEDTKYNIKRWTLNSPIQSKGYAVFNQTIMGITNKIRLSKMVLIDNRIRSPYRMDSLATSIMPTLSMIGLDIKVTSTAKVTLTSRFNRHAC